MANEEKILEMLTNMQTQMNGMQTQMGQMQTQMDQTQEWQERAQVQLDRTQEWQERTQVRLDRMQTQMDQTQDDLHRVKLYLELDVEKRFDAINEGIDMILEKLLPEERMEKAEDDIIVLKTAVRALARDIAELKKAQ